ncbi:hypothetical protein FB192DRAFT_1326004, partial [Mucor lusitanicus]
MNYHNIASHSGPVPLPSLMYVDCPPLPPPQQQQDMQHPQTKKRPNKVHVSAACINCKKAHLACDVSRPCNRCVTTDKADTCRDIQHKKRGRPKMMRDANNNKIRPAAVTQSMSSNHRIMSGPNVDFFSMVPAATSNDMMTVFLSMDLCCARVSDKSLEYLELYPQEFGHRSLYDFLVPGETQSSLSKLHRCLLDNAVQHQQHTRLPHDLLRSSSEKFFSFSIDSLLNIANGSLTLKQKLKFKKGRGAFGADLFDASTFDQLYIVCIASPIVSAMNINDVIHLPPLMMNGNNDSKSVLDRFRYNTKTPTQQFIHPNELYYLQTTSSRLSSEAIAHTAYPYLSKTPASAAAVGSGPLANYNNQFKK